jgi:hypothetical protein
MINLLVIKKDLVQEDKGKIARQIVGLISLLGVRDEVLRMLRDY